MARLTAEIVCRTVFGRQLGAEHAAEIVAAFSEYRRLIGQFDMAYFFGLPDWIPRFHSPAIHRSAKRIHKVLEQVIGDCRERLSSGEASMIRLLLEARDPESGEPLDDVALRNEAAVIFMAGHETTANSLAWAGICCRERPRSKNASTTNWEKCSPAACRPSTTSPSCSIRAPSSRRRCGYTPVPLLARQALCDETIRGRSVPAGSLVIVVPCLLHRHRKLWGKPDHYIPERFSREVARSRVRRAFIPFSVGPRICGGAAFGLPLTEAILWIATLAQRVRLRLAPDAVVAPICRLTLRPGDDLRMIVENRA